MKALVIALVLLTGPAMARDLQFPSGTVTAGGVLNLAPEHILPVSAFIDGKVDRQAFKGTRIDTVSRVTPAQPVDALTDALIKQLTGMDVVFDCRTNVCGGFDFRFALDVLPEPEMHVDLTDFRYVLATNAAKTEAVALVISRSALSSFVQVTEIRPSSGPQPDPEQIETPAILPEKPGAPVTAVAPPSLVAELEDKGHAVLDDLVFATGTSDLGAGEFASLDALAAWLKDHPEARVAIVGHTDAVGSADGNISLSRRRASSVVDRLTSAYGVKSSQLEPLGAGYMAPRASNQTEEGRQQNRRVEVVVIALEPQ